MLTNTRGKIYVDRDVQTALVWQLFFQWSLFMMVLSGILFAIDVFSTGALLPLTDHLGRMWERYSPLLLVMIGMLPVCMCDSIRLSHRFVGPLVRLRKALRQAALGETPTTLEFRQHDFWQDLAVNFNALMLRMPGKTAGRADCESPPPAVESKMPVSV